MSTEGTPAGPVARLEVEVAATPEDVWQAIATGPGNAGWLFPADIEGREGGSMVIHRAPFGGDAPAKVTAWDPPRRFAYSEDMSESADASSPPWVTEFLVEGRGGGSTVVRVISGFYEGGDGWEDMVAGAGEGWSIGLQMLRVYVSSFLGQRPVGVGATGDTGKPLDERGSLSQQLLGAFDLTGARAGDKVRAPDDAPPLAGVVEYASEHVIIARSDDPGPGVFEISTFSMDGRTVTVSVVGRLYGGGVDDAARRDTPRWAAWLQDRFALPAAPATLR